jgi:hypothetical protein
MHFVQSGFPFQAFLPLQIALPNPHIFSLNFNFSIFSPIFHPFLPLVLRLSLVLASVAMTICEVAHLEFQSESLCQVVEHPLTKHVAYKIHMYGI